MLKVEGYLILAQIFFDGIDKEGMHHHKQKYRKQQLTLTEMT